MMHRPPQAHQPVWIPVAEAGRWRSPAIPAWQLPSERDTLNSESREPISGGTLGCVSRGDQIIRGAIRRPAAIFRVARFLVRQIYSYQKNSPAAADTHTLDEARVERRGNYWLFPETEDIFTAAAGGDESPATVRRAPRYHRERGTCRLPMVAND